MSFLILAAISRIAWEELKISKLNWLIMLIFAIKNIVSHRENKIRGNQKGSSKTIFLCFYFFAYQQPNTVIWKSLRLNVRYTIE